MIFTFVHFACSPAWLARFIPILPQLHLCDRSLCHLENSLWQNVWFDCYFAYASFCCPESKLAIFRFSIARCFPSYVALFAREMDSFTFCQSYLHCQFCRLLPSCRLLRATYSYQHDSSPDTFFHYSRRYIYLALIPPFSFFFWVGSVAATVLFRQACHHCMMLSTRLSLYQNTGSLACSLWS
jgi:hypothetical protein